MNKDRLTTKDNNATGNLHKPLVSGLLPSWWNLQIEQLKELEKVIEKRIKELEEKTIKK